jgi:hypothetical protein
LIGVNPWQERLIVGSLTGVGFELRLSLPDAIVTKAYAPILIVGAVGGLLLGGILHGWR